MSVTVILGGISVRVPEVCRCVICDEPMGVEDLINNRAVVMTGKAADVWLHAQHVIDAYNSGTGKELTDRIARIYAAKQGAFN